MFDLKLTDLIILQMKPHESCATDLTFLLDECRDGRHVDLVFSSNSAKVTSNEDRKLTARNIHVPKKVGLHYLAEFFYYVISFLIVFFLYLRFS